MSETWKDSECVVLLWFRLRVEAARGCCGYLFSGKGEPDSIYLLTTGAKESLYMNIKITAPCMNQLALLRFPR